MSTLMQPAVLNAEKIREQFPVLHQKVHGKDLIYFDNAATTQKPRRVIDALVGYYEGYNANIHRGIHALSEEATSLYEGSRKKTAQFIGATIGEDAINHHGRHLE